MEEAQFIVYEIDNHSIVADVIIKDETIWMPQKQMGQIFDVGVSAISKHLKNIFEEEELNKKLVISKMETTTKQKSHTPHRQTVSVRNNKKYP